MTSVKDADQGVFFPSFYRVPGRASFPEFTRASSLKLVRPAATARALSRSRTACGGKYLTSCLTRVGGPEIRLCPCLAHNKNPGLFRNRGFWNGEPDDVLLSLEIQPTIIGDKVFHCPVRNGKEWDHLSMVIRQRLCCASSEFFTWSETKLSCDSLTQKFS